MHYSSKKFEKLMHEIYRTLAKQIHSLSDMFQVKDNTYNLRSKNLFMLPQTRTASSGNDSSSFRGSILWNSLPNDIKIATSVYSFKSHIRNWNGENCRARYVNRYTCFGFLKALSKLTWVNESVIR